jgi:hypothetical protein
MPQDATVDALITRLESEVTFLRSELADRTEEIRRRDHIVAGLVEQLRALPATIDTRRRFYPGPASVCAPMAASRSQQLIETCTSNRTTTTTMLPSAAVTLSHRSTPSQRHSA